MNTINITGTRYFKLKVIKKSEIQNNNGVLWDVKCDCGSFRQYLTSELRRGTLKSCGCYRDSEKKKRPASLIPYRYWDKFLRTSKRRNIEVKINAQYIQNLFESQKSKCALSGELINLPTYKETRYGGCSASLDRIDSGKGYIEGNVQWVHKNVNFMKQNMAEQKFIDWCLKIVKFKNKYE